MEEGVMRGKGWLEFKGKGLRKEGRDQPCIQGSFIVSFPGPQIYKLGFQL